MELQRKVAEAIHVLNHDPESSNRVAANQWLVQFQLTPAAWDVSTSLLTSPIVSLFDLQFFAAQILRRKVSSFIISDSLFSTPQKPFFNPLFLCCVFRFRTKHRIFNLQLKMLFSMPFFLLLRDIAPVFLRYCCTLFVFLR